MYKRRGEILSLGHCNLQDSIYQVSLYSIFPYLLIFTVSVLFLYQQLLENDTSWEFTNPQAVDRGAPTRSISLLERGENSLVLSKETAEEEDDDDEKGKTPPKGKRTRYSYIRSKETALFLATMSGIPEIVEEILKKYPQAIEHYNDQGRNILHVAINYRQIEIFDMVVRWKCRLGDYYGRQMLKGIPFCTWLARKENAMS